MNSCPECGRPDDIGCHELCMADVHDISSAPIPPEYLGGAA